MTILKSDQPLAQIIIASPAGQGVRYPATLDLAMIVIWFLGSVTARALALVVYDVVMSLRAWRASARNWLADLSADLWIACRVLRLIVLEVNYAITTV